MSKHWRPKGKVVRLRPVAGRKWTRVDAYGFRPRSRKGDDAGRLLLIALFFALGQDVGPDWRPTPTPEVGRSKDIQWDKVQKVPKAASDPADLEWERRAEGSASMSSSDAQGDDMPVVFRGHASGSSQTPSRVTYVFDGDTFEMDGRRVRIVNIDAPELHPPRCAEEQRLGLAAKTKLAAILSSGSLTLSGSGHDEYGRDLRYVAVNGQDVGEAMISAGVAREYGSGRRPWC